MARGILLGLIVAMALGVRSEKEFQTIYRDYGGNGFSFNPSPFFCNSVPQFPACGQPAIPICCGPCYQAQPAAVAPGGAGNAVNPQVPNGGAGGAGGAAGAPTPTAAPPQPTPSNTPFVPPAPVATAAPVPEASQAPVVGGSSAAPVVPPVGSTVAPPPENNTANCPIGCPAGWNTWGPLTDHCYLLASQPAHLDTFWAQQAFCKSTEPNSYVVVSNSLLEQATGSAVALQYAANWLAVATNGFIWLGCYVDGDQWKCLDGSDPTGNILFTLAAILGNKKNGTCLGADPKTLGVWQTRPCDDNTGAVWCEMPKRPVCGAQGGALPITPVSLSLESIKNLFPKMPSIPFLGQILGGGGNGGGITGALGNLAGNILGNQAAAA